MPEFLEVQESIPDSIVPLIALVTNLRQRGFQITVQLPQDDNTRSLFHRCNWAHFLDPNFPLSDDYSDRHLAVLHLRSEHDHRRATEAIVDIALRTLEISREAIGALEWAASEIMDNVLQHSGSDLGGFVQLQTYPKEGQLAFCVADTGRGILNSLKEAYSNLQSDEIAIGQAVRAGVTRNNEIGQGNGLSGSLGIAMATEGRFRIVSGRGEVEWANNRPSHSTNSFEKSYLGTIVDVQFPFRRAINLAQILADATNTPDYSPVDFFDRHYTSEDGRFSVVRMSEETAGFGSRRAGFQIHTKCKNLLNVDSGCRLRIDWDGIQMIASSYADEFIGKLFVALGPLGFMSRIEQINLSPVVQSLINRAIMQRTKQALDGEIFSDD